MNFFKGRIESGKFIGDKGLALNLNGKQQTTQGMPAVCGLRPEHIRIAEGGQAARVLVVEPMGSETQVVADMGGQQVVCLFRERIAASPGQEIPITADPGLAHLFAAETGVRLN